MFFNKKQEYVCVFDGGPVRGGIFEIHDSYVE